MMRLYKRFKYYLWYRFVGKDKTEIIFQDKVPNGFIPMRYIPDVVFDRDAKMYNAGYNAEYDSYNVLVGAMKQRFEV